MAITHAFDAARFSTGLDWRKCSLERFVKNYNRILCEHLRQCGFGDILMRTLMSGDRWNYFGNNTLKKKAFAGIVFLGIFWKSYDSLGNRIKTMRYSKGIPLDELDFKTD